jgi:putative membrane protein
MNKRTHAVITLVATTLLGSGIFVLAADPTPANQPAQPAAANMAQPADQHVDRQIADEIRQFGQDPKTAPDKMFVLDADLDSSMEIAVCQQALTKAQDNQIKDLANHMIADHQKLNQKLQQVAQKLNVELPSGTPEIPAAKLEALNALSGHDYEVQLLAMLDAGHAKAIACFQATAANSQEAQVKQLASDAIPKLQMHREMVDQTATALGINLGQNEATPAAAHIPGANGNQMDTGGGSGTGTNAPATGTPGTGAPQK